MRATKLRHTPLSADILFTTGRRAQARRPGTPYCGADMTDPAAPGAGNQPGEPPARATRFGWMKEPPWPSVLLTAGGILVMLLIALAIPALREALSLALHGDTSGLRDHLHDLGVWGGVLVIVLGAVHAVVWYPSEILNLAVGYVYGFVGGLALLMVAWTVCAIIAYGIGRRIGTPVLQKLIGPDRFEYLEALIERGGVMLLLIVRLIPIVPFAPFCIVAGSVEVPFWRFLWTSIVAYIPLTAMFAYFGSQLNEPFSLTDPVLWIGTTVLIGLVVAGHYAGKALHRRHVAETNSGE